MGHNPGFERLVEQRKSQVRECKPSQVMGRFERGDVFHFIDVREDHEVAQGYAQGAIHKGRGILERDIEEMIPDKNAEIILYCGGGYRSAVVGRQLARDGLYASFFDGWRNEGVAAGRLSSGARS